MDYFFKKKQRHKKTVMFIYTFIVPIEATTTVTGWVFYLKCLRSSRTYLYYMLYASYGMGFNQASRSGSALKVVGPFDAVLVVGGLS